MAMHLVRVFDVMSGCDILLAALTIAAGALVDIMF